MTAVDLATRFADLEREHASLVGAAQRVCRGRARAMAKRFDTAAPPWASVRPPGGFGRKDAVTLERLESAYAAAGTAKKRAEICARARALAGKLGVAIPDWVVAPRPKPSGAPERTTPASSEKRHGPAVRFARESDAFLRGEPVELDSALVAWRKRHRELGAVVCVGRGGVELHALGRDVLRFNSVEAAVAAIA